ncbi:MAG TPA: hypothetical protein VFH70_01125 [Acidimicrobiales bacterium]|nr:hypothetical protein [Acidimicrobiales bacterium]
MISPPGRDDLYPGRLPPVRTQWAAWPVAARVASAGVPLAVIGIAFALDIRAGITLAVFFVGMAAASVVYVKNRTDRHNAAVERGEIGVIADPRFRPVERAQVPSDILERTAALGHGAGDLGRVVRFDGGWIVGQRNPRDVAVVLGDDGGWARFDPRTVTDLWAVGEYRAGRGRDG